MSLTCMRNSAGETQDGTAGEEGRGRETCRRAVESCRQGVGTPCPQCPLIRDVRPCLSIKSKENADKGGVQGRKQSIKWQKHLPPLGLDTRVSARPLGDKHVNNFLEAAVFQG